VTIWRFFCKSDFTWNQFLVNSQCKKREILSHWKNISWNMWKWRKFTLTLFWQKFRESNCFTTKVTKELISRNIFFLWHWISSFSTLWIVNIRKCYFDIFDFGEFLKHFLAEISQNLDLEVLKIKKMPVSESQNLDFE